MKTTFTWMKVTKLMKYFNEFLDDNWKQMNFLDETFDQLNAWMKVIPKQL